MPTFTDPSNNSKSTKVDITNSNPQQIIFDFDKIKDFNAKSVDLIFEDKIENALEILKKMEVYLEANALESKTKIDKKTLIIILHNLACCFQKLKDFENCISYLEAVIYHFDSSLEPKHKIKINADYFIKSFHQDQSSYSLLGDFILELRFSAKFHLQMCAVLSQANRHIEALTHAKLATLMCEDNLIKTYYLYNQMREKEISSQNKTDEEYAMFADKIKQSYKIINELYHRVINIRGNTERKESISFYDSYIKYRNKEIFQYTSDSLLTSNIRNVFGNNIKKDDWIQLLNIGNIMFLSALNYEDLDLDSDPKYELLRDAILEKVVMLTVSYFCIATELRFLSPDKQNQKINGEFYHYKAVEFASLFLPVSCPIIKHYIISYYKHYGNDMNVVPEGEVCNMKIELVRSEIEQDKDALTFVTAKKLGYTNWLSNIKMGDSKESEFDIPNNAYLAKKTKIKDDIAPKFKLNFMNINNNNNNNNDNNNAKEDSFGNSNNIFNKTNSQSNVNSNNSSERIILRQRAKTDRVKISKMNISKKGHLYYDNTIKHNNNRKSSTKHSVGNQKKSGSITDRIQCIKEKMTNEEDSNEKMKCKTKREVHSIEVVFKASQNNNSKISNQKIKGVGNNKNLLKIKEKGDDNSGKPKMKKEINTILLDKLFSTSKKRNKADNGLYSSTSSSINSLIMILNPKKSINTKQTNLYK